MQVPEALPLTSLYSLAALCEKYDAAALIQPFVGKWVEKLSPITCGPGVEKWLYVAWVFKLPDAFSFLVSNLVPEVSLDESGRCLGPEDVDFSGTLPLGIVDDILQARNTMLEDVINTTHRYLGGFTTPLRFPFAWEDCHIHEYAAECKELLMTSYIHGLDSLGLWPSKPAPQDIRMSANELVARIDAFPLLAHHKCTHCHMRATFKEKLMMNLQMAPLYGAGLKYEHWAHFGYAEEVPDPKVQMSKGLLDAGFVKKDFEDEGLEMEDDDEDGDDGDYVPEAMEDVEEEFAADDDEEDVEM